LPERRGEVDVILAPRGAAKSTLVSLVLPIHALLYETEGFIVLISATMRQATKRLSSIKSALLSEGPIKKIFGEKLRRLTHHSARSIELDGRRLEAYSAGTELRGISCGPWRPTWIILDDVERSERTRVAEHREALADWFREVIENLGDRYTNIEMYI